MYKGGDDLAKRMVVDILFQYHRSNGFPHIKMTNEQRDERMKRLIKSPLVIENDTIPLNYVGMDLANSFHHHLEEGKYSYGKMMSPVEAYNDDEKFKDCINRWLELGNKPNRSGIRRILRTRNGVRGVCNFRPTAAKYIYDSYCPDGGKILDPCSGYSGRLIGCISSGRGLYYHGIDPDTKTALGNMECASYFKNKYDFGFSFSLGMAEEEMGNLCSDHFDLVFTSPPYFDTEIYSSEQTQSCHKYKTYDGWLNGFLFVMAKEGLRVLKSGGYMIINIKNYKNNKIVDDLIDFCGKNNLPLVRTLYLALPNNEFDRQNTTKHTEPVLVFQKP